MSKILIIGGAGGLGSHLVEEILKQGTIEGQVQNRHNVVVLDDYSTESSMHENNQVGATYFNVDVSRTSDYSFFMNEPNVIFHMAYRPNTSGTQNSYEVIRDNLNSAGNALLFAFQKKAKLIMILKPYGHKTYYQDTDIMSMRMIKMLIKFYKSLDPNFDVSVVTTYNLYGERVYKGVIYEWLRQKEYNVPLTVYGNGSQKRPFTYAGDVARSLYELMKTPCNEELVDIILSKTTSYSVIELARLFKSEIELQDLKEGDDYSIEHDLEALKDKIKDQYKGVKTYIKDKLNEEI